MTDAARAGRSHPRAAALFVLSMLGLAGCAPMVPPHALSAASPAADGSLAWLTDEAGGFRPVMVPSDAEGLFALDDSMRHFAQTELARAIRQVGPTQGLVEALYRRDALQLQYDPSRTRAAAETFAARRGNCLSLVIMTAAFARHLGLAVDFRAALLDPSWSRRGALYVSSGHVNITVGRRLGDRGRDAFGATARLTVDFLPPEDLLGLRTRPITERELLAMYLNNRAAEVLADGALDEAHAWALAALRAGPERATAWNTLGAVFRRHGDTALAVRAFRAALARAPEHMSAMANLAQALAAQGLASEAAHWSQRLAALEAHPPFEDLQRGWAAIAQRDWRQARAAFEREMRRSGPAADLHHGLAIAAQHLGEAAEARRQLDAALSSSTDGQERQRFLAKIDRLGSAAVVQ